MDYVFGLARNERLRRRIGKAMRQAAGRSQADGPGRRGSSPSFATGRARAGARARRVVAKAEQIEGKENPRFVVTSLAGRPVAAAATCTRDLYCARGEMENRIKEQMSLFADRMSAETMRANQLRLYLSSAAYVLVEALRRLALKGTELAEAQVDTIRLRLLKIGARIRFRRGAWWCR